MNQLTNSFRVLLFLLFLLTGNAYQSTAQDFSYVYIQGDKKIPIYTKVEGVMMPRYGKNYALLSRLAPGPLNVEILFQQNEYPPLSFTILVPENGKRAFVLNKKGDAFSLYDVEQNFYLSPGNSAADDHLPTVLNNASLNVVTLNSKVSAFQEEIIAEPAKAEPDRKKEKIKKEIPDEQRENAEVPVPPVKETVAVDPAKPKFIEDITFNNDAGKTNTGSITTAGNNTENTVPAVTNSDCSGNINALSFQKLQNVIDARKTEDEQLGQLLDATRQNCFSTDQAAILVKKLTSDTAKYSALRSLYPKITDQANFSSLEALISSEDWKESFRTLLQSH